MHSKPVEETEVIQNPLREGLDGNYSKCSSFPFFKKKFPKRDSLVLCRRNRHLGGSSTSLLSYAKGFRGDEFRKSLHRTDRLPHRAALVLSDVKESDHDCDF
ncbi:hypothetical protein NPIL_415211 [Nephila pilipes]|uniref:Uncharacterized protein n=1 Tax=Nephila pilipes TaxID=299642 RepID=A0A8X6MYI8_NEPPI|nr:hypothetical protein NPIL_415211 [Nephila pilipes]